MNCERYLNQIENLIENKLDEQAAEQITLHLISCRSCEAEFEKLFEQKEIYVNFLFGIEPPLNLATKFRSKLEIEKSPSVISEWISESRELLSKTFAFLRLNAVWAMTAAVVLLMICLGLFNYAERENIRRKDEAAQQKTEISQPISPEAIRNSPKNDLSYAAVSRKPKKTQKEIEKKTPQLISFRQKQAEPKRAIAAKNFSLNAEEENQFAQIQSLEIDSARQMEKVEMLFRSFRNARSIEETGRYDVDYEKQQARKLLRNNAELKQRAESYGTLLTEEMLNKVEPYLLDIANLDSNAPAEKVSEIKARFRSQNIIASLQGF